MRVIFLLCGLLSICQNSNGVYQAGSPGAEWSIEEMLAVKHLLYQMMANPRKALQKVQKGPVSGLDGKEYTGEQIMKRYKAFNGQGESAIQDAILPDVAKMVRLAFHDCLPDTETGGCNGCLNFRNMGVEGQGQKAQGCFIKGTCKMDKTPKETDNNNLLWAARVLELIYNFKALKVPKFHKSSQDKYKQLAGKSIAGSLRENGKSRADLWAFAGLTAVELGVKLQNPFCDGTDMTKFCGGNPNGGICEVQLPMPEFKFGRKDCTSTCADPDDFYGFCTPETEAHPDPHGNGKAVTSFLNEHFKLGAKESVALMGAHSLGHTNELISGFRHYPWTGFFGKRVLNNDYYKMIADPAGWTRVRREPMWKGIWNNKCRSQESSYLGDEFGNPKQMHWVVRSQWLNNDGGPWVWQPFANLCDKRICDQIQGDLDPASCCHYFNDQGKVVNGGSNFVCDSLHETRFNCSVPTFMRASMMNVDMGLFTKFEASAGDDSGMGQGRPTGCSGLNRQSWLDNERYRRGKVHTSSPAPTFDENTYLDYSSKWMAGKFVGNARFSDVVGGQRFSGCPLNMDLAENGQKMHEIVEEYAADNNVFVKDFSAVFSKMIENGYQAGNSKENAVLQSASWEWVNMFCNTKTCWAT